MPNMTFCRIKVIKGRQYAYLVKSYRDKTTGKNKQKVIKYLGNLEKVKRGLNV